MNDLLDLKGKIAMTDAMRCQKDIAEKIRNREGDYLFAVKGNQGKLYRGIEETFPVKRINDPGLDSFVTEREVMDVREHGYMLSCDILNELIDYAFAWKDLRK